MKLKSIFTKVICVFIILAFVFSLVGCGGKTSNEQPKSEDKETPKSTQSAKGFSWDMAKGAKIKVLFNQHPYADAIIKKLPEFETKTGIKVEYSITPEENYFDKVTTSLNSRSGDPDIFMTGAYQVWEYAPAGYMQELDEFLNDPNLTEASYDYNDFYPGIVGSLRWDLVAGHKTGTGPQWALPMAFEGNCLMYNKRVFKEKGLTPPKTLDELYDLCEKLNEFDGKGSYALAVRGSRNWATIHPGYMTTFSNMGAKDFEIENGKLVSKVNSKEAVEMTDLWVKMIKAGGPPAWSSYTWYQAGADFGAGKAAMLFDADILGYFNNVEGSSKEAGNFAWVRPPLPSGQDKASANLWVWSLAMNKASKNKQAAWLFLQNFTTKEFHLWAAVEAKCVIPPRKSVFDDPQFAAVISKADGFTEAFKEYIDGTGIQFSPQPHFFETTTEWAATLQDLVAGKYSSTQEAMDQLKVKIDKAVADVEVK